METWERLQQKELEDHIPTINTRKRQAQNYS